MKKRMKNITFTVALVALLLAGCGKALSSGVMEERVTFGSKVENTKDITEESESKKMEESNEEKEKKIPEVGIDYENTTYIENLGEKSVRYFSGNANICVSISTKEKPEIFPDLYVSQMIKQKNDLEEKWQYIKVEEKTKIMPTWEEIDEGKWKASLLLPPDELGEDSGYVVIVEPFDLEGNELESIESDLIVFDESIPLVSIDYEQEGLSFGDNQYEYYNHPLDIVFSYEDPEILSEETVLVIKKDGQEYDTTYEPLKTISEDGEYEVYFSVKDKGGHISGINLPKTIVIDTKINKPLITINSQESDGLAIKGEAELLLEFEDKNILDTDVRVSLSTIDNENTDITNQISLNQDENTGKIRLNTSFPREKKWDGTYKVSAQIRDKAGNEEQQELRFTLNRFGSTFSYGEYLNQIISEAYIYKFLDQDLVINEVNPTKVLEEKTKVLITRDGKPVSEVKCQVESVNQNSWWKNTYVLSKDNFVGDGLYKVMLVTEDMVSNIGELNPKDNKEIQFMVDNTAPDIQRISWKREDNKIKLNCILFDTFGIREIRVYKNGELIDTVIEDNKDNTEVNKTFIIPDENEDMSLEIVAVDFTGNENIKECRIQAFVKENEVVEETIELHVDGIEAEIQDSPSFPIWVLIPVGLILFAAVFFILKKSL